jgi:uncharacterized protein (DUF433 family)
MEARIIDVGRGPQIAGTRITVYDILDYTKHDWHPNSIALWLNLSTEQVLAAIRYIEEHKDEVLAEYQEMLERDVQGNPPEIEAKRQVSHAKLMAKLEEIRRAKGQEGNRAGNHGGP